MISVKEAFGKLPENLQKLMKGAYKYGDDGYLFVCPEGEDDSSDPFYLVLNDGHILELNPFDDLDGFNVAMSSPVSLED